MKASFFHPYLGVSGSHDNFLSAFQQVFELKFTFVIIQRSVLVFDEPLTEAV